MPSRTGQRAGASNLSSSSAAASSADDDARAEMVVLIDDLKERLRKSETESEQFQKQAQVLQLRLDEALSEQGKLEDRLHESDERLEALENGQREAQKQKREMEAIYEAERSSMLKDREEMGNREEEMQVIIQRLKDSLSQKSSADDETRLSRRCKPIPQTLQDHIDTNTLQRTTPLPASMDNLHPLPV
jgi:chromosome segregation ATPase